VTKISENLAISAGSAIPNLSTAQIKEIVFPLPPLAEQLRIVARVNELRSLCAELRRRFAACQVNQAQLADVLAVSN
jgi:type I restriction enzyme S subunit